MAKRIMTEYSRMQLKPSDKYKVIMNEQNIQTWQVVITGQKGSLYEGHNLKAVLTFGQEYPFRPPTLKFTSALFHPNISPAGDVCNNVLSSDWSPTMQISFLLDNIINMLECPNVDDPLNTDAANMYKSDREAYNAKVKSLLKN